MEVDKILRWSILIDTRCSLSRLSSERPSGGELVVLPKPPWYRPAPPRPAVPALGGYIEFHGDGPDGVEAAKLFTDGPPSRAPRCAFGLGSLGSVHLGRAGRYWSVPRRVTPGGMQG